MASFFTKFLCEALVYFLVEVDLRACKVTFYRLHGEITAIERKRTGLEDSR